jgi:hypothetical protein
LRKFSRPSSSLSRFLPNSTSFLDI